MVEQECRLSVIVPVPTHDHRPAVLDSLAIPWSGIGRIEVLVAVGGSPSRQRNLAAQMACAKTLYFLDEDSHVSPRTVDRMLDRLASSRANALGGPALTHPRAQLFERCVGEVMATSLGSGLARARAIPLGEPRRVAGEELVGCNLMIEKRWYLQVGGLDESLYPGEDVDLMKRLHTAGALLLYDPEASVERTRRRDIWQFAYQFYRYGRARGLGFHKSPRALDLVFLMPAVLLLYAALARWLPPQGLLLYAALILVEAVRIGWKLRAGGALALCLALFPIQHLAYGWGTLAGLLRLPTRGPGPVLGVKRHVLDL